MESYLRNDLLKCAFVTYDRLYLQCNSDDRSSTLITVSQYVTLHLFLVTGTSQVREIVRIIGVHLGIPTLKFSDPHFLVKFRATSCLILKFIKTLTMGTLRMSATNKRLRASQDMQSSNK